MSTLVKQVIALHLTAAAFAVAFILLTRSNTLAFSSPPLVSGRLLALGLVLMLSSAGWEFAWAESAPPRSVITTLSRNLLLVALPSFLTFLAVAQGSTFWETSLFSLLSLTTLAVTQRNAVRRLVAELSESDPPAAQGGEFAHNESAPSVVEAVEEHDESVEQTWTRRIDQGMESVEGEIFVDFRLGERRKVVHFPLQPMLSDVPDVEIEPHTAEDLTIKVELATAFGVRFEVMRADAATNKRVGISVSLSAPVAFSEAA